MLNKFCYLISIVYVNVFCFGDETSAVFPSFISASSPPSRAGGKMKSDIQIIAYGSMRHSQVLLPNLLRLIEDLATSRMLSNLDSSRDREASVVYLVAFGNT